jgi:DNA-binding transcriptional LysR family regulator
MLASEVSEQRQLKLGLIDSIAKELFKSDIFAVTNDLNVRVDNSSRLLKALKLDQLDMAIITQPVNHLDDRYEIIAKREEGFELVCASDHVKEVRRQLIDEHVLYDFLTYDQQSTTFKWIGRHLAAQNIEIRPSFYSTSPELMLATALKGKGSALLPNSIIRQGLKSGKLKPVANIGFKRPLVAVVLKDKYISVKIQEVLTLFERQFRNIEKIDHGRYA